MYANEPLILAVLIADRRAALQRAATPSRTTPTSNRPSRLRRLIDVVMQRKRPSPESSTMAQQDPVEAAVTRRPAPVTAETPSDLHQEARDLDTVLV